MGSDDEGIITRKSKRKQAVDKKAEAASTTVKKEEDSTPTTTASSSSESKPPATSTTPIRSRKNRKPITTKKETKEDDKEEEKEEKKAEEKPAKSSKRKLKDDDDDEDEEIKEADDDSEPDEDMKDEEYDEEKPIKRKPRARTSTKSTKGKKAAPKRKRKTKDSDDEEDEEEKKPAKKRKTTTKKKEKSEDGEEEKKPKKESKRKKKEEEEENGYKWWLEESTEEIQNKKYSQKWKTFKHSGVMFPPDYEPVNIPVVYKGKEIKLDPEAEEVAFMYAVMRESDYYTNATFKSNFWKSWQSVLGEDHEIQDLEGCDFTLMWEHFVVEKDKKKNKSKEEKQAEKEAKEKLEEPFKYAEIDGRKEKVANFRIEPPGLFRGRGNHPLAGTLKKRVNPEDVTINIGKKEDCPAPPEGHQWKDVISNNTVTWLAMWKDSIKGEFKYVNLGASSSFKGRSDFLKYETARKLKDKVDDIRENYKKDWKSKDDLTKQRAVALYLIDKLALRVGNEKDADEADTVGCCSLRVEHIKLEEPTTVHFDFLGKDSIRYQNSVQVETQAFKVLKSLTKGKESSDELFDKLSTTSLNSYLKSIMDKLTAKVFRTFNASLTLDTQLRINEEDLKGKSVTEKLAFYNAANKQVAILCNHQRAAPKTFQDQVKRMDEKIEEMQKYLDSLKEVKKEMQKKDYEDIKAQWDKNYEDILATYEKQLEDYESKKKELEEKAEVTEKGKGLAAIKKLLKELKAPKKPAKKALPKNEEAVEKAIEKAKTKIKEYETQKQMKIDNKTVALGTARINYCDPRITVAWCKRNEVPINKIFNKSLMQKFPWAMDVEEDYEF